MRIGSLVFKLFVEYRFLTVGGQLHYVSKHILLSRGGLRSLCSSTAAACSAVETFGPLRFLAHRLRSIDGG